ncbi:hypothetical protein LXA43DRAFT_1088618 [Ganoderma leucocontextum]|nr:hypothetical protein LXA43DRAFT_1088618 [Ganoderma leucocontextum]
MTSSPTVVKPADPDATASAGYSEEPERNPMLQAYSSITKEELGFCIKMFVFIRMKLSHRIPAYSALLKLGQEREGAILVDIGCCFGNDVRKAVSDGFPVENCVATDIHPARFLAGDVFDPAHLERVPPFTFTPAAPRPHLPTLNSLNPLRGHVSAIHVSAVFHLFSEEEQVRLAHSLAGLLSPESGSTIFGLQSGRAEKGFRIEAGVPNSHGRQIFCHSPESWKELWEDVFPRAWFASTLT